MMSVFRLKKILSVCPYTAITARDIKVRHNIMVVLIGVCAFVLTFMYAGFTGLYVLGAVVLAFVWSMARLYKNFGGVSGDLLGYCLVVGELCGLIVMAILTGQVSV